MIILLSPFRSEEQLSVSKEGNTLTVNGELYDFSRMGEGDTLPASAVTSTWIDRDVEYVDGQLVVTLLFPNPWNYSPEQAFPVPLLNVPDGPVSFPQPLPAEASIEDQVEVASE